MKPADHIKVDRLGYWHHGLFTGRGGVIHYSGTLFNKRGAAIKRGTIEEFAGGSAIHVVKYSNAIPAKETLFRAESCLGERDYSLLANNCEHFAVWCKTGRHESQQIDHLLGLGLQIISDMRGILRAANRHRKLRSGFARTARRAELREREKTQALIDEEDRKLRAQKFALNAHLARLARANSGRGAATRFADRERVERAAARLMSTLTPEIAEANFVITKLNQLLSST
jgi:hypothetical protein